MNHSLVEISALIFSFLIGVVVLFQLALAAGMPWGAASMGGKFPGRYPGYMRFVAILNAALLAVLGLIVLTAAGLILPDWHPESQIGIYFVVGFGFLSAIMNNITPSKIERRIWGPVTIFLFLTSLIVALK